jgi:acyl carrier protein
MLEQVRSILSEALQLGDRAQGLAPDTQLLGSIAEFDSMTVVTVLTLLEDRLGLEIEDDDISADVFETVGSLVCFVESKCSA